MNKYDAKHMKIAYIGGGSRGWAWGFMMDLAKDPDLCGEVRLYDIDIEAAERNRVIGEKISAHPDAVSKWTYTVPHTLQEALTGVDFVVISILPGTFDEMESDVPCRSVWACTSPWAIPWAPAASCGPCAPFPCLWKLRRLSGIMRRMPSS